jgi:hypothetical protein
MSECMPRARGSWKTPNVSLLAAILCTAPAWAVLKGGRDYAAHTITVAGCVQSKGAMSSATMDGGYLLTNTQRACA